MSYMAIEGETPRPIEDLRDLLPGVSFVEDDLATAPDIAEFIALAGYEPCAITNTQSSVQVAWNQVAQLGVASRVGGALQASWVAVALSQEAQAAILAEKRNAVTADAVSSAVVAYDAPERFATGTGNDPVVFMRPNVDVISAMSQALLLVGMQQLNGGGSPTTEVTDSNGNAVSLTSAQLLTLVQSLVKRNKEIVSSRTVLRAAITNASSTDAAQSALDSYNATILALTLQTAGALDIETIDASPVAAVQLYTAT